MKERLLINLARDCRGGISILSALALPLVVGAVGLAVELGNGYAVRVENQTTADMAALAAAQVYSVNKSTGEMQAAAQDVTAAAGLLPTSVSTILTDSPDGSGNQAVKATVTTQEPYFFSRVLGVGSSFSVTATAYARLGPDTAPCILALGQNINHGVEVYGGSDLAAIDCSVVTNSDVHAQGGSNIAATSISAHTTISAKGGSSVTTSPTADQMEEGADIVADPLADNADILAAKAKIGTYTPVQVPTLSLVKGTEFAPGWSSTSYVHKNASGTSLTGTYNSGTSTWTFPAGTYDISKLSVAGGQKIAFQGPVTLNIKGDIESTGAGLSIGAGAAGNSVNITGKVKVTGGSSLTIGDGTVKILDELTNSSTVTIGNGRHYFGPITASGNISVGDGDTDINGKLKVNGGNTATFGDGAFAISVNSGDAIDLGGAAKFEVGDGAFSVNGDITGGGSSNFIFGATANHYINGDMAMRGDATLGAGSYIVSGDLTNQTTGVMTGTDVTFVLGGNMTIGGSADLNIKAAEDNSSGALADILIISDDSGDTTIEAGSDSTLTGIIYVPNSNLTVKAGGELSGGGECWSLVANKVTIYGGANATTNACSPLGGSGTGGSSIKLVR
jgi:Flp pilus assembly protein TadG